MNRDRRFIIDSEIRIWKLDVNLRAMRLTFDYGDLNVLNNYFLTGSSYLNKNTPRAYIDEYKKIERDISVLMTFESQHGEGSFLNIDHKNFKPTDIYHVKTGGVASQLDDCANGKKLELRRSMHSVTFKTQYASAD